MPYAIISLGGKQYRVQEGERLTVDRLPHGEDKTFHPDVLMLGGDGTFELAPKGVQVTARVVAHSLGQKIRIGKYRPKSGYRKHTGHRSRVSQVVIESIGTKKAAPKKAEEKPKAAPKSKAKAATKPKAEAKPKAAAAKKTPARKPAAKKTTEKK